jgi:hypothetical protein
MGQQQGPPGIPTMGGDIANQLAQVGASGPQPQINPVIDTYDNIPPIVREAARRRLFTEGM